MDGGIKIQLKGGQARQKAPPGRQFFLFDFYYFILILYIVLTVLGKKGEVMKDVY